jgi:DNA-binding NarL/FixJ family response regulator
VDRVRVLVVDEHRIFAESLATALTAEQDVEATAVGSVPAALHLMERARAANEHPFDVLLMDVDLDGAILSAPDGRGDLQSGGPASVGGEAATGGVGGESGGGPSLLAAAHQRYPGIRSVMLAAYDDPFRAAQALAAGACGWVAKDSSLARLLQVLRGVLRDETHVPPALLTGVLRELTRERRHRDEHERLVESLTPRELEVLRCMLAGLGRKAVAERLYLSPHTVRTHMQNVLSKLGVHSTLAAVALARRAGIPPAE